MQPMQQSVQKCKGRNMSEELNLLDVWRHMNPVTKSFTFHSLPHSTVSRIDYIFISRHMAHLVERSDIGVMALSDHAPVTVVMKPPRPLEQTVFWELNRSLFLDCDFIKFLEEQTDLDLNFNDRDDADPRIVWEAYKAYMRGMLISYTSRKKKERQLHKANMKQK